MGPACEPSGQLTRHLDPNRQCMPPVHSHRTALRSPVGPQWAAVTSQVCTAAQWWSLSVSCTKTLGFCSCIAIAVVLLLRETVRVRSCSTMPSCMLPSTSKHSIPGSGCRVSRALAAAPRLQCRCVPDLSARPPGRHVRSEAASKRSFCGCRGYSWCRVHRANLPRRGRGAPLHGGAIEEQGDDIPLATLPRATAESGTWHIRCQCALVSVSCAVSLVAGGMRARGSRVCCEAPPPVSAGTSCTPAAAAVPPTRTQTFIRVKYWTFE